MKKDAILWDIVNNIYKQSENKYDFVNLCNDYWDGKIQLSKQVELINDTDYSKTHTAFNLVKPIIETKQKAITDAQFTLSVIPKIKQFSTLKDIKKQRKIADIFDNELKNIFNENKIDLITDKTVRIGLNCGFSVVQTMWDDEKDERGEIKLNTIPSENLIYDKNAKNIDDSTFIGYKFSLGIAKAKNIYCKNEDGIFDEKKCGVIDRLAGTKATYTTNQKTGAVGNYQTDFGAGQAYVLKSDGICAGKTINLICLYLVDDSIYIPEEDDTDKEKKYKKTALAKYPNGRMIIFSDNDKEKFILEDKPLPKTFNTLGNLDIFNPTVWKDITGKGEVEDIISIQDRVNGLYNKYREKMTNEISSIMLEKDEDISLNDFIRHPVMFLKKGAVPPQYISNNGISLAMETLAMVEQFGRFALQISRINETMAYGYRQTGTTSANQVEALQESPLTDIRAYQRNYKNFFIDIGNKILTLIRNNYTVDRLIKLNSNFDEAEYAKLQINADTGQQEMVLVNELGETIEIIKMNEDWEYEVEVIAGTSIPRTKKELSIFMDNLLNLGVLDIKDLDMLEEYLRSQDIPNYRNIINIMRNKQETMQKYEDSPESNNWKNLFNNPQVAKEFSSLFSSLAGYPLAQQAILNEVGLPNAPGNIETTPVSEITSKSEVSDIAGIDPTKISNDPEKMALGYEYAIQDELKKGG